MVKKHKIIESYEVVLYCDECGAKMLPSKFRYPENDFENLCPNCGAQVFTKQSFPFQNVWFENEGIPVKINEHGNLEDL